MKLIVAGGRDFNNYPLLVETLECNFDVDDLEIISGCARGADKMGEAFAGKWVLPVKRFPANWDKHGKAAGYIRNKAMAEYADALLAFWDGKSKGTGHMIDIATKAGLRVEVINYG